MLLLSSLSLSNFYQLFVCLHRQDRERTDIFLIEDSSDKAFQALLLTDGSSTNAQGLPKEFTSTGSSGGLHKTSNVGSIFEERKPPGAPAAASAPASAAPPCPPAAATAKPAAAAAPAAASGPLVFSTTVRKGEHGIGLDLTKTANGRANIQRFKELPNAAVNPALQCNPPIKPNDVIIGVNGKACATFADVIKTIRALDGEITLQLERAN
jgi:pyruvate/2-oxoglutarate dehydrogenase complex dihydrolipoamide acyltransferase (E2) component